MTCLLVASVHSQMTSDLYNVVRSTEQFEASPTVRMESTNSKFLVFTSLAKLHAKPSFVETVGHQWRLAGAE